MFSLQALLGDAIVQTKGPEGAVFAESIDGKTGFAKRHMTFEGFTIQPDIPEAAADPQLPPPLPLPSSRAPIPVFNISEGLWSLGESTKHPEPGTNPEDFAFLETVEVVAEEPESTEGSEISVVEEDGEITVRPSRPDPETLRRAEAGGAAPVHVPAFESRLADAGERVLPQPEQPVEDDASRRTATGPAAPSVPPGLPQGNPEPPAAPRRAPPEWASAIGLNLQPGKAPTDRPVPARSDARVPVAPPGIASSDAPAGLGGPVPAETPEAAPLAPRPAPDIRSERPPIEEQQPQAAAVARDLPERAATPHDSDSSLRAREPAPARQTVSAAHDTGAARSRAVPVREIRPGPESRDLMPAGTTGVDTAAIEESTRPQDTGRFRAEAVSVRPVIGQVVQTIARNLPDGVVEIRLQPEELGRLRLAISQVDAGHVVQVTAERPETLDLVRRHIDLLATDLKDRGFGSLDFTFGQEHSNHQVPQEVSAPSDEPRNHTGNGIAAQIASTQILAPDGRLDIRV